MKTFTQLPKHQLVAALAVGCGLLSFSAARAQATNTWTGARDTVYTRPANWSLRRVPSSTDNVIIPANGTSVSAAPATGTGNVTVVVARQPSLSAALGIGTAGNLIINTGAFLRLNPQSELDLYGNLTNNGKFAGRGTLATMGTPALHTISGSGSAITISDLRIMSSAPAILGIPVRLSRLLALTGNLTTTSVGTLTLLSTPDVTTFVTANNGGVVIGSVTVQRAIDDSENPGLGYRHYSSPVSNTTVADLTTAGFTPVVNAAYNTSSAPATVRPFPTVYGYNQALVNRTNSSPNFDKGFFSPVAVSDPLVPGRGYAVNIDGAQLVDFVGMLNNGDISVPMSRNAAGTLNSGDAGWQFLGNPYPAPIDYSMVAPADRPGLDAAIYVYSSTSQYGGEYRAYVNDVGGNPVLPLGQGFFARLSTPGSSSTFTFRNSQRLTTSDGTTFQRTAADARPQVELTLAGASKPAAVDYLNLYFQAGSTSGVDTEFDAVKLHNPSGLNLNSLASDGQALAIDGRPLPAGQLTVPLRVAIPASGSYTLSARKLQNLNGLHPYLRDIQQGKLVDLGQQASYTFTLDAANATPRFELLFTQQPLAAAPAALVQQVALYPSPAKDLAFIELPNNLGTQAIPAVLVDALGRNVRTAVLPAQGTAKHELSLTGLGSGVYALRLSTSAGVVVKRLVIE